MCVCLILILIIFHSCTKIKSSQEIRLIDAKWKYFESNFECKYGIWKLKFPTKDSLVNICYLNNFKIDSVWFHDTLELNFNIVDPEGVHWAPKNCGVYLEVFGFYPNIDTVVYRTSSTYQTRRTPDGNEEDSISFRKPLSKLHKQFGNFLNIHKDSINPWLYLEAKRRGIIK